MNVNRCTQDVCMSHNVITKKNSVTFIDTAKCLAKQIDQHKDLSQ